MRRDYRLGLLGGADPAFELGVEAERRARPLPGGTDHGALARATVRCSRRVRAPRPRLWRLFSGRPGKSTSAR